jgi:hypothetical protein
MVKLAIGEPPYNLKRFQNGTIMASFFDCQREGGKSKKDLWRGGNVGGKAPNKD